MCQEKHKKEPDVDVDAKILQVPKGIKKNEIYKHLPYDKKVELSGFVFKRKIYCYTGDEDSAGHFPQPELEKELTFHTHPLNSSPIIPSEGYIVKLLIGYSKRDVFGTAEEIIVFDIPDNIPKNRILKALTTKSIVVLFKKKNHREFYRKVLQQYILDTKDVRLKITDASWMKDWQKIIEKYVGIKVTIIPQTLS